jgi:ligand-binding SRPBCC domain-containing protein
VAQIQLFTTVRPPIETVFDAARHIDLHQRSLAHTGERVVAGRTNALIGIGGSEFERPTLFMAKRVEGPVKSFRDVHRFEESAGRILMTDE